MITHLSNTLEEFKPLFTTIDNLTLEALESSESEDFRNGIKYACKVINANLSAYALEKVAQSVLKDDKNYGEDF